MNYKVNGEFETTVVLNKEDKELFDSIKRHGVEKLHVELEASHIMPGVYSNVSVELEEMFDKGIDDWHGSIKITADVKATVSATSKENALTFVQDNCSSEFAHERVHLFTGNGDMIELKSSGSFIEFDSSVAYTDRVDEYFLIKAY